MPDYVVTIGGKYWPRQIKVFAPSASDAEKDVKLEPGENVVDVAMAGEAVTLKRKELAL